MKPFLRGLAMAYRVPACSGARCAGARYHWQRWTAGFKVNGQWFCDGCAEATLGQWLEARFQEAPQAPESAHRLPLGLILLARGRVERRALEHALEAQRAAGHGRIGDWLQQLSSVSERDVTAALSQQWGCPMFSLAKPPDPGAMALVPLPLLEEFDMVPVRYDVRRGTLFLAFGGTVAHAAMLAIESMLDCRVHPCVAESSRVRALHEQLRQRAVPGTYVFPTASDAAEMARVALSYGRRLEARAVRTAKLRSLVWIRLERAAKFTDLLFRFPEVPGRGMARSGPRPLKLESAGADNREGYGNHHAKSADSHRG